MVVSSGVGVKPGLHEHSPAFAAALGSMTACFAERCRTLGLYPVMS